MSLEEIPLNQPYDAHIVDFELLQVLSFESTLALPAKTYFVDLRGRENLTRYEWKCSGLEKQRIMKNLKDFLMLYNVDNWQIPHVIVTFPHVTSVYRFGNPKAGQSETNLHKVGLCDTRTLETKIPLELIAGPETLEDRSVEVACPAELFIVAHEMALRARASNIGEYIRMYKPVGPLIEVKDPNLIRNQMAE